MKTSFKLSLACAVLALASAAGLRAADPSTDNSAPPPPPPHEHGQGGRRGPSIEMLTEKLSLTADQQTQIGALLKKQFAEAEALRNDPSLTQDQKRDKFRASREQGAKDIEALLTPDQVTKFQAMRKEMRGRGPRGDGPPPPPPGT